MTDKQENEVQLNRRSKPNLGGRPKLEDIDRLTPEMEEIAQKVRAGFTAPEIADDLNISIEKVERLWANPHCRARIDKLFGDRPKEIVLRRDQLFDETVDSMIRLLRKDALPPNIMEGLLKRLDPYERLMIMTEREKELQGKEKSSDIKTIPETTGKKKSVFGPIEMERKEDAE